MSFDGRTVGQKRIRGVARAATRTELGRFLRDGNDARAGVWAARPVGRSGGVLPALFRALDHRNLQAPPAQLSVRVIGGAVVEVRARTYAHAVQLDLPAGAVPSDDYFDLLPGEVRRIAVQSARPLSGRNVRVRAVNCLPAAASTTRR